MPIPIAGGVNFYPEEVEMVLIGLILLADLILGMIMLDWTGIDRWVLNGIIKVAARFMRSLANLNRVS